MALLAAFSLAGTVPRALAATVSTCVESEFDAALAGGGPISFSCDGTIGFTTTKLIVGSVVIDGSGQSVTLDGGGSVGLFRVDNGGSLTLRNLTLTRGREPGGGAVRVQPGGRLDATGVTFEDNSAPYGGAIANSGVTRVVSSAFRRNLSDGAVAHYSGSGGGAISNDAGGILTVESSIFEGNSAPLLFEREPNVRPSAGQGGAIQNRGVATIVASTFTGNLAFDGGAINNQASPVIPGTGLLLIVNSTLARDVATFGGEEVYNGGALKIVNSTLVGSAEADGSAIAHYPFLFNPEYVLHVTNSILAVRGCVTNTFDNTIDGGGNLVSGAPGHGCGLPEGPDPGLGLLQDNGGGVPTMAIVKSSPAFQRGVKGACDAPLPNGASAIDQRGSARFSCSSGAFEPSADPASLHFLFLPFVALN